jgi:hypothetical protein
LGLATYVDYALALETLNRPTFHLTRYLVTRCRPPQLSREIQCVLRDASIQRIVSLVEYPVAYTVSDASDVGWSLAMVIPFRFHGSWRVLCAATAGDWLSLSPEPSFARSSPCSWHINIKELFPLWIASKFLRAACFSGQWVPIMDSRVAKGILWPLGNR